VLPDWAQEGAAKAVAERLADPALRARIAAELDDSGRDWSKVMIGGAWHEETRRLCGLTVEEARGDESPGDFVCRVLALDGCKTGAFFFGMSEENMRRILAEPWIVPGSDASLRAPWGPLGEDHPHPRAYSTMPEFYRLTRDVARMTSVPARRLGLSRRGVLAKGCYADIAVWDGDKFAGTATYENPHRFADGMKCVIVNGIITYADGRFTGRRGGRFLERNGI